jgi:Tfp pilus assembly protein PilN
VRPVNLLPSRYRRARASGERTGIAYIAIGTLAVVLLMVVLYVVTQNGINDAKDKTAKAEAEAAAAQARIGQLQPYGNFAQLKVARENAVAGIAEVRFDYERLMREMALVLPHNVYLTAFTAAPGGATTTTPASGTTTIAATGPTVSLTGCAPSHPGVATTLVRLRQLHNVDSVDLTSSTKQASGTSGTTASPCKVQWVGTATFKPESAPTGPAPVPARLGGGQ